MPGTDVVRDLQTLNEIAESLNRAVDVRGVLEVALARLVHLMGLETGWIFLQDPGARERWWGPGYVLAAHYNLPPALDLENPDAWDGGCDCQGLCNKGKLTEAYNEVRCTRLAAVHGDRRGLRVHASAPLRSGDEVLGILNVAGRDWSSFTPESLALLTNAGSQMGVALARARLFDLLREQRIHEQAILLDLSTQFLQRHDLDDLMAYLVDETRRLLEADACALLLPASDADALEFRAASGWRGDPVAARRRVPGGGADDPGSHPEGAGGDESGPGWVMRTQRPLLVDDIQAHDPVPWLPPWLQAEGFRSHTIVPLVAGGRSTGVLVLDLRRPGALDDDALRLLRLIANQAALALERARLHEEELRREQYEQELALARQIQLSLLPGACPTLSGWECATYYEAARIVGGDFYDFVELPGEPRRIGIVIADVAGKGVGAALFMALSRTAIRTAAPGSAGPAEALVRASDVIRAESRSATFVTVFYAVLDVDSGRLVYANAGHARPLWSCQTTGEIRALAAEGIVVGVLQEVKLEEVTVNLAPGDLVLFYTDGVTEAMDAAGQPFGEERLRQVVAAHRDAGAQGLVDAVVAAVKTFSAGRSQSDDLTLVALKRETDPPEQGHFGFEDYGEDR